MKALKPFEAPQFRGRKEILGAEKVLRITKKCKNPSFLNYKFEL